jgi:hypothetical protein
VAQIDVLAVIAASVAERYPNPELRVSHLFNVANDVLAANAVPLRLELVRTVNVAYPDGPDAPTALNDLTFGTHPALASVAALRQSAHADLVVLVRPYGNDGYCGYAWVGGTGTGGDLSSAAQADFGFSVVAADCSDYALVHELGHNLGLVHSRREAPAGGSLAYGAGFGRDNDFVTLMATPGVFNAVQLPVFSNPSRQCHDSPCGVSYTDSSNGADAVRALATTVGQVATYR